MSEIPIVRLSEILFLSQGDTDSELDYSGFNSKVREDSEGLFNLACRESLYSPQRHRGRRDSTEKRNLCAPSVLSVSLW